MDERKRQHQLSVILKKLMVESDIDDIRLANLTGVPFTTIARMRSNPKANPTVASLRPLAKNFGISISQLLGDEPLPPNRLTKALLDKNSISTRIPIIPWDKVMNSMLNDKSAFKDIVGWVSVNLPTSINSYALRIDHLGYGSRFPDDALLIVDPEVLPQSGNTVLIKLNQDLNILLKDIIIEDSIVYLKSVNPELTHIVTLSEPYTLCGSIIEVRKTLHLDSFSDIKYRSEQYVELAAA
jgi:SOS-response transcriptional repressor LexA